MSCLGWRKSKSDETEPLLSQYDEDTDLQVQLHRKLHTYQMLRALSKGFLPSNDQVIVNLRTLLSSEVLNSSNPDLSRSGQLLTRYTKRWLVEFIELLLHKNSHDEIQDCLWFLTKSRISLDADDLVKSATQVKARADASAAYASLKTVGSLLLTNSDFRIFVADLNIIGKQVFADTATVAGDTLKGVAREIEPSKAENKSVQEPGADAANAVTTEDLDADLDGVKKVLVSGAAETGQEAYKSLVENLSNEQRDTLLNRLKNAVLKLRKRNDYNDSVSTIGLLIKRYALIYSRAAEQTVETLQDDVQPNPALERAVKNFWSLVSSFGDNKEWEKLRGLFNKVTEHAQRDPEFEQLMGNVAKATEKMLTEPSFFDHAGEKVQELQEQARNFGTESDLRADVEALIHQVQVTLLSVYNDEDVSKLVNTSLKILSILMPADDAINRELLDDFVQVSIPLIISAIQFIPIPRLEIAVPEIDLLVENLIIEPGRTVNNSSFLPYRLRVETYNDLEIMKKKFQTVSKVTSITTIKLDGLSVKADQLGFWFRAHSGIFRLADEGIASFELDDRGIDIHIDVEIGKEKLESMLTLRDVRVKVHHLSYTLRKSKFACLAWLFKPLLRPILRKALEKQLATAISDFFHAANREIVFARERLRATRISNPDDIRTFIKAIITRLTPEPDPNLYASVGVTPTKHTVFSGVYAPGSLVKVWNEEAVEAPEIIDDNAEGKWRNAVFDTHVEPATNGV